MKKDKWLKLRINPEKHSTFKKKATEEYGDMSKFLDQQIDSFLLKEPIANDAELTALLYAVKALNSYTNNINQIAKKLNAGEHEKINNDEVLNIHEQVGGVVRTFKKCLETRRDCFD